MSALGSDHACSPAFTAYCPFIPPSVHGPSALSRYLHTHVRVLSLSSAVSSDGSGFRASEPWDPIGSGAHTSQRSTLGCVCRCWPPSAQSALGYGGDRRFKNPVDRSRFKLRRTTFRVRQVEHAVVQEMVDAVSVCQSSPIHSKAPPTVLRGEDMGLSCPAPPPFPPKSKESSRFSRACGVCVDGGSGVRTVRLCGPKTLGVLCYPTVCGVGSDSFSGWKRCTEKQI